MVKRINNVIGDLPIFTDSYHSFCTTSGRIDQIGGKHLRDDPFLISLVKHFEAGTNRPGDKQERRRAPFSFNCSDKSRMDSPEEIMSSQR